MVSNNTLAPALHQRLQRSLVAFAENRPAAARSEIARPMADRPVIAGKFRFPDKELVEVFSQGKAASIKRGGLNYPAYPTGSAVRYVPGLDAYLTATPRGGLHYLTLYEDIVARSVPPQP